MKTLNYKGDRTPEDVLASLVEAGSEEFLRADCRTMDFDKKSSDQHARDAAKIGELTFKREGDHNEILKSLKSDDIQDVRFPRHDAIQYVYDAKTKQHIVDPTFRPGRKRPGVVSLPNDK